MPVQSTGVNVYDVRRGCDPNQKLCYDFSAVEEYLDQEDVQEALGVHSERKGGQWKDCSPLVDLVRGLGKESSHKAVEGLVNYGWNVQR